MNSISGLFNDNKVFSVGYFVIGPSVKCRICGMSKSTDYVVDGVCAVDCSYEVSFCKKNKDMLINLGFDKDKDIFIKNPELVINKIYEYTYNDYDKNALKFLMKKIKFACRINYYKSGYINNIINKIGRPYGHDYGYILKDPYTELEISNFENKINAKLPSELRYYLINISREILINYPVTFDLTIYKEWTPDVLPMSDFQKRYIHDSNKYPNCDNECSEDDHFIDYDNHGMLYIGNGGCEFGYYMSMTGIVYYSDSTYFNKYSDSFMSVVNK